MLFETDDGVSLCVWVKYSDSESYLEEMKLSNGESIFIAQPEREFEVMVTSAGTYRKTLSVDCCLGKSLQHDTQQQQLSIVVDSIKPLQPLLLFRVGSTHLNSLFHAYGPCGPGHHETWSSVSAEQEQNVSSNQQWLTQDRLHIQSWPLTLVIMACANFQIEWKSICWSRLH